MCNGGLISNSLVLMIMWTEMRYFYIIITKPKPFDDINWFESLPSIFCQLVGNRLPGLFAGCGVAYSRQRNMILMTGFSRSYYPHSFRYFVVSCGLSGSLGQWRVRLGIYSERRMQIKRPNILILSQ